MNQQERIDTLGAVVARAQVEQIRDFSDAEIDRVFDNCVMAGWCKRMFYQLIGQGLTHDHVTQDVWRAVARRLVNPPEFPGYSLEYCFDGVKLRAGGPNHTVSWSDHWELIDELKDRGYLYAVDGGPDTYGHTSFHVVEKYRRQS